MLSVKQKCFFFNLGKLLFCIPFPSPLASSISAWLLHLNKDALSVFFFLFLQERGRSTRGASAGCQGGDATSVMLSRREGTKLIAVACLVGGI